MQNKLEHNILELNALTILNIIVIVEYMEQNEQLNSEIQCHCSCCIHNQKRVIHLRNHC